MQAIVVKTPETLHEPQIIVSLFTDMLINFIVHRLEVTCDSSIDSIAKSTSHNEHAVAAKETNIIGAYITTPSSSQSSALCWSNLTKASTFFKTSSSTARICVVPRKDSRDACI